MPRYRIPVTVTLTAPSLALASVAKHLLHAGVLSSLSSPETQSLVKSAELNIEVHNVEEVLGDPTPG